MSRSWPQVGADGAARRMPRGRRGVLLLVVLSMLTLFLMLGVSYVVTAKRAHEAARAYARLTQGGDEARVPHARMLDDVLLRVVRGGQAPTAPGGGPPLAPFESILEDKYGVNSGTGTADLSLPASLMGTPAGILTGKLTLSASTPRPTDLNGRVLTLCQPGRPVTTHRIIRATAVGSPANPPTNVFDVAVDTPWKLGPLVGTKASMRAIVNGREFDGSGKNEPWDGFDAAANPFIARLLPTAAVSSSTVTALSFVPTLTSGALSSSYDYDGDLIPDAADNDNDGQLDGVFLDFGLPDARDANGNVVQVRASVLVVDLDGRFNVNAHGSLSGLMYPDGHTGWQAAAVALPTLKDAPLGSGYGPAEIQANLASGSAPRSPSTGSPPAEARRLFDQSVMTSGTVSVPPTGTNAPAACENPVTNLMAGVNFEDSGTSMPRQRGLRTPGSRFSLGEDTYRLRPLEGKYGERSPYSWISLGTTLIGSGASYPYARPGERNRDDPSSYTATRRVPYDAADQSLNYGIPPAWWLTGAVVGTGSTFNWTASISGTLRSSGPSVPFPAVRGVYNSPPDLHGRMKTVMLAPTGDAVVPSLAFAKPEWPITPAAGKVPMGEMRETQDDPYELRLDTRRGFGSWLHDPNTGGLAVGRLLDNPFTPAELESVLRPYDIDSNRLPPRLTAVLGSVSEESRLKVTTDSWDTTAITGQAVTTIAAWLAASTGPLYDQGTTQGVIGGEVARGERFDLNRPLAPPGFLHADAQRQAYFKDLYTLLCALTNVRDEDLNNNRKLDKQPVNEDTDGDGELDVSEEDTNHNGVLDLPAEDVNHDGILQTVWPLAQWAANVVDFRDADSTMSRFDYDDNPADGWTPGANDVVWGTERPEMLITETAAWEDATTGELFIMLHRPWNAKAYATQATTPPTTIPAEPIDARFDTTAVPTDTLDLGRKSGGAAFTSNVTYPIWRLRIVDSASPPNTIIARFDVQGSVTGTDFGPQAISGSTTTPRLGADSWLCVRGVSNSQNVTVPSGGQVVSTGTTGSVVMTGSQAFRVPGTLPTTSGVNRQATVYLERLDDPAKPVSTTANPAAWTTGPPPAAAPSPSYRIVDSAPIEIVNRVPPAGGGAAPAPEVRRRDKALFWKNTFGPLQGPPRLEPLNMQGGKAMWFPWPNRPFVSVAEALLVPQGDAETILRDYQTFSPALSGAVQPGGRVPVPLELFFDAVQVPTRFADVHTTTANPAAVSALDAAGVSSVTTPVNQLSSFREPGRININTITGSDVWNAVVAGPLDQPRVVPSTAQLGITVTGTEPVHPAQSVFAAILTLSGTSSTIVSDTTTTILISQTTTNPTGGSIVTVSATSGTMPTNVLAWDKNPHHGIYTATRLANTTTTRSNVFAVWITLRESVAKDPDSVRYRRAFYIVDRSIPVGFEPGQDLNVWDCIRVRRIVE